MNYPGYGDIGRADWDMDVAVGVGLALNIRVSNRIGLATGLYLSYLGHDFQYGENGNGSDDYAVLINTSNATIDVPILLRIGKRVGGYFEVGYQLGFPVSSDFEVTSGSEFPDKIKSTKDFAGFRVENDQGIVIGFGGRGYDEVGKNNHRSGIFGVRLVYHLTRFDKAGNFYAPLIIGVTMGRDL